MYLLYFSEGSRAYGKRPIVPHSRKRWAFQINLGGSCTLLVQEGGEPRHLRIEGAWATVAGPECVHAWVGHPEDCNEVAVFHFDEVSPLLESVVGRKGWRAFRITETEVRMVRQWAERCREALAERHLAQQIFQIVGGELSLMVLKTIPKSELGPSPDLAELKVAQAIAWYTTRLASGPTIGEVAEALHLSPAHLRRLFHRATQRSPQAVLSRVQFERAIELMRDPRITLEQVAENAGFGSASAFSRAFRAAYGVPPVVYRRQLKNEAEGQTKIRRHPDSEHKEGNGH